MGRARRSLDAHAAVLLCILLVGLVLRSWGLPWGLHDANISRRPHPDEWTIFYLFQWFNAGGSLAPCVPHSNQCFFDWGVTFPYLAYASHFLTAPLVQLIPRSVFGSGASMSFVTVALEGRIWSVFISTATILLVYVLARLCYGLLAGLVAACVFSLAGLPVQLAHFATPDTTTSFLVTAVLVAADAGLRTSVARWFSMAGLLTGLAVGTEYHMVLLAIPVAVAWFLTNRRSPQWAISAVLCGVGAFFLSNPYVLVDYSSFWSAIQHTISIRTVKSVAEYGDRWAPYQPAPLYVLRFPLGFGAGWPLALCMTAGVIWSFARRR